MKNLQPYNNICPIVINQVEEIGKIFIIPKNNQNIDINIDNTINDDKNKPEIGISQGGTKNGNLYLVNMVFFLISTRPSPYWQISPILQHPPNTAHLGYRKVNLQSMLAMSHFHKSLISFSQKMPFSAPFRFHKATGFHSRANSDSPRRYAYPFLRRRQ